jgi:hypothetical protein
VDVGIAATDELNYIKAMVWDLGYVNRVIKPGPKTMWSVNVYGDPKVLTITAPTGFIRVNRRLYLSIVRQELTAADFAHTVMSDWPTLIETAMTNAAQRCLEVIVAAAPEDTGEMRESLVVTVGNSSATFDDVESIFE